MTVRERLNKVMNFEKPDRLPVFELAGWWGKTIENWRDKDGLDWDKFWADSYGYMDMDKHYLFFIQNKTSKFVYPPDKEGAPQIVDEKDYDEFKKEHLFPEDMVTYWENHIRQLKEIQDRGDATVWINFEGFFWFPRTLFGIEPHFYAFYDYPELMQKMNTELCEFLLKRIDEFCAICVPDFCVISEDMSYNHGPMCSKAIFDEFMAPYYLKLVKKLKDYGIKVLVDSDGNPEEMIPWFIEVGVEGIHPCERQAGTDINRIRENYPNFLLMSGFNKMVMDKGEEAIRAEFERIFPVMCQGGYIPACDHQTPPNVSFAQYKQYQAIQREYCQKAAVNWKGKK